MKEYEHEFVQHWLLSPTLLEKQGGLWFVRAGMNQAKSNYAVPSRFLTYYSLHFVLSGTGTVRYGDTDYPVSKGDLFCLFPQQLHAYETERSDTLSMFWISFEGPQAQALLNYAGLSRSRPLLYGSIDNRVLDIVQTMCGKLETSTIEKGMSIMGDFYNLIDHLRASIPITESLALQRHWLQESIDFINVHFAKITVQEAADHAGKNRSYFTTAFTEALSISPKKYLNKIKMQHAASLLKDTTLTLGDISSSLGFEDVYSFSKAFKSFFRYSPSEYRKSQLQAEPSNARLKPFPKEGYVVMFEHFDDQHLEETPEHFDLFGESVSVLQAPDLVGNAMCLRTTGTSVTFAERSFSSVTGTFRLQLRLRPGQVQAAIGVHLLDAFNRYVGRVSLNNSGTLSYTYQSTWTRTGIQYAENTWNTIELEADLDLKLFNLSFNKKLVAENARLEPSPSSLTKIRISMQGVGELYADDIKLIKF
ncbi:AraC family transcriptional regulator [Paenibacillus sp. SAF-054]|uniref:AraC family transcriptional regulator n=1 Tax=unclassified Paenibacillus TaxID=185978 RepID=UPI003F7D5B98